MALSDLLGIGDGFNTSVYFACTRHSLFLLFNQFVRSAVLLGVFSDSLLQRSFCVFAEFLRRFDAFADFRIVAVHELDEAISN